jgi:hypothetical protein
MLMNLIIQLIAGALSGNAIGKASPNFDLGAIGNTIAGAIGGGAGGQILQALVPLLAGTATGGLDIGSLIGNAVGGGAAGAIVTAVVGALKNKIFS